MSTMMTLVRLVAITGDSNLSIELQPGPNRIGRQRVDNHIVLVGPEISRFHCEIHVETDRVVLKDLGSANGTFVDAERVVGEREVHTGDRIRFSDQFEFELVLDPVSVVSDSMTLSGGSEAGLPQTAPTAAEDGSGDPVPVSLRQRSERLEQARPPSLPAEPRSSVRAAQVLPPRADPVQPKVAMGGGQTEGEEQPKRETLSGFEGPIPGDSGPARSLERPGAASPTAGAEALASDLPAPVPASGHVSRGSSERVPLLRSPADQVLMERISEVAEIGLRDGGRTTSEVALLEREREQLAVLYQVSKRCMAAENLTELDRLLINVLERIVPFDRGFISYQLPNGDWKLVMSPKGDRWERKSVRSLLQQALKGKKPLLVRDSRRDDALGAPLPGRTDARLLLPLVARGTAVGTVFITATQPGSLDDHVVDFLALFADIAALSVINCARLEMQG